ncbi:hypothetical protein AVEN_256099-1 [Araneus ventricosus]|uniref:Secreted protein n=1 Tax=Araneus ventricosus TaxID=182803 RepID=A0A4Y2D7T0_ARAVE|nr:hypothetical protein AVEN_256099-1 [Araneus ventricosus]
MWARNSWISKMVLASPGCIVMNLWLSATSEDETNFLWDVSAGSIMCRPKVSYLCEECRTNLTNLLKPCSYGLSFHEFRPRFALFPVVGTGRNNVAREIVSAFVVSRVMAVNSTHVKGGGEARRLQCISSLEGCREIRQATRRRNSTDHIPQVRTSSDSRFAKR